MNISYSTFLSFNKKKQIAYMNYILQFLVNKEYYEEAAVLRDYIIEYEDNIYKNNLLKEDKIVTFLYGDLTEE